MESLITALFNWGATTPYAQYFTLFIFFCYVLAQVIQYLPIAWTEKIPNPIMVFINIVAGKHGAAKSAQTDLAGNKIDS